MPRSTYVFLPFFLGTYTLSLYLMLHHQFSCTLVRLPEIFCVHFKNVSDYLTWVLTVNEIFASKISVTRCVSIRFRLCWRNSDDLFVCFGAKLTQKGLRTRFPTRPEVGEGRKVWEKTERVVENGGRREQSAWDSCPENDTVSRRQWEDVGATQMISLSVLAQNSHKRAWGRDFPQDRKWGREGRSERRQREWLKTEAEENSRLEIAVQRMTQLAGGSEKMEVGQWRESTEVRNVTAKICWPTEAELTNARSIGCSFVDVSRKIHACNSQQNPQRAAQCHIRGGTIKLSP